MNIHKRTYGLKTVDFYILKTFLSAFVTVFLLFAVIGFIIVLFSELDNIREENIPFGLGLAYILLSLPHEIVRATPIVVVISMIIGIGNLVKNREMLMLNVGGYTPLRLAAPLAVVLCMIIGSVFLFNEYISAPMSARAEQLRNIRIRGDEEGFIALKGSGIWLHGKGNRVYHAMEYHPHLNRIRGLMILEFDGPNNTISARLNAEVGIWNKDAGAWILRDVVAHIVQEDGTVKREIHQEQTYTFEYSPQDFARGVQKAEEMSYSNLKDLVASIREAGEDPRMYLPDLRIKEAFPFAIFFLGMLTYTMVLRSSTGTRATGIGLGLLAVIGYFLVLSLGKSFAESGKISATLGAWGPNILCFFLMVYFFYRLREEI